MRFNNRNMKLAFLTTRCIYWGIRSAPWSAYMSFDNRNLKMPFFATRCLYWGELSNPLNCQFWHHSCVWLKRATPKLVSHTYLIFRNKWDIKHFLFFPTFSYHLEILYEPHCQGGLYLTWLYNANWLITTLIIQKEQKFQPFLEESKMAANYIP